MTVNVKATNKVSEVVSLNLAISAFSAQRDINLEALGVDVTRLPKQAAKVLRSNIVPTEFLRNYNKLRQRAEAACHIKGARQPLGYVNTKGSAVMAIAKLNEIDEEWQKQKEIDAERYDQMLKTHVQSLVDEAVEAGANEAQAEVIREAIVQRQLRWEDADDALQFGYFITPIVLDETDFDPDFYQAQARSVVSIKEGVMGELIRETCAISREIFEALLERESKSLQKSLEPCVSSRTVCRIYDLIEKLDELGFLHKRIRDVNEAIQFVMNPLRHASNQALRGSNYQSFKMLVKSLSDQVDVVNKLDRGLPLISVTQDDSDSDLFSVSSAPVKDVEVPDADSQQHDQNEFLAENCEGSLDGQCDNSVKEEMTTETEKPATSYSFIF